MPRSSFSQNPLLRVSRPVSACSRCRSAKVKCDGKLPACTACEKAGRESECSAANDNFARGKERSYVAALELRVEKLERRLEFAKSLKASSNAQKPDVSTAKNETASVGHDIAAQGDTERRDSLAFIRDAVRRKAAKNKETADVNDIVSEFGFLTVNATVRDFDSATTKLTFARFLLAAATNDALPDLADLELPPRQEAQAILQFYLTNIYSLFPCVQETALLTALDDLYSHDDRVMGASDFWLIYVALAIGSAAQSRRRGDFHYENGVKFISKALEYADQSLALGSASHLRSLVLLTLYSMLDPSHFDSWYLVGFTARAAIDLGYHQDPLSSTVSDDVVLNMRRKLFYCIYALDREISMVHAGTFSFPDASTDVAFPRAMDAGRRGSLVSTITGPQSSDPALVLFQIRRAQSWWYQELHLAQSIPLGSPIGFLWQMCLEMREWGESLPEGLPAGIRQMFDQELIYSYVYCLAPSARVPQTTDYNRCLIFQYTQQYLNTMHEIAHASINTALYTYNDALKTLFTANQLLGVLRESETMLLFGPRPSVPMVQPGYPPPPPMPQPAAQQDAAASPARVLRCLEKVSQTLEKFAERWEAVGLLKQSFEALGRDMIDHLRAKIQGQDVSADSRPSQQYRQNLASTLPSGAALALNEQMQEGEPHTSGLQQWSENPYSNITQGGTQRYGTS